MLKKLFGFGKEKKEEQSIGQNEETKSGVKPAALSFSTTCCNNGFPATGTIALGK